MSAEPRYNVKLTLISRSACRPIGENNFLLYVQSIFTFEIVWTVGRLWPGDSVDSWPSVTRFTFCRFCHHYSKRSIRYAAMSRSSDQTNLLLCRESNPALPFVMLQPLNVTSKFHRTMWGLPQNTAESDVGTGGCARVGFRYCPLAPC